MPTLPQGNDEQHGGGAPEEISPCTDPTSKKESDKDAAAARVPETIKQDAADNSKFVGSRERTVVVYKAANGAMKLGTMGKGATGTGAAPWRFDGIDMGTVQGLVHNHPGGSQRPSAADWAVFDRIRADIAAAGGNPDDLRMYMVGNVYTPGNPNPEHRIFVYDNRNRSGEDIGPEVNPDGLPC